jgi:hypothetical protein
VETVSETTREVKQDDILDLVNCAGDYGHANQVCMCTLYEWAHPVTDEDIERYSAELAAAEGYGQEDGDEARERLTEWRDKHRAIDERAK